MANEKSIFDLSDKFWMDDSPFSEWLKEDTTNEEENSYRVVRIDGPYDDSGLKVNCVSRFHRYSYFIELNKLPKRESVSQLKLAISCDNEEAVSQINAIAEIKDSRLRVSINIYEGTDKFKLYAYFGNDINRRILVEVNYKKTVAFFIGGAGDKEKYGGVGPTNIVEREVYKPFSSISPLNDYIGFYLGYNYVYDDGKNGRIKSNVLSNIRSKENTEIYIIGHSLGGWNGAHLFDILQKKGYKVKVLITLDPVGTKVAVSLASDIYWDSPKPKCDFWFNVSTDPDELRQDDYVADIGGQWNPGDAPLVNVSTKFHHGEAGNMFRHVLYLNQSCSELLLIHINKYLQDK